MVDTTKPCPVCYEDLDPNDILIECQNNHQCCSECAQNWAITELNNLVEGQFQVKCYCKALLKMEKLMTILKVEDCNRIFSKSLKSASTSFLKPNETLMMCNFCNFYAFVCPKDNKWLFFRCHYEKCEMKNKTICTVCGIECDDAQSGRDDILPMEEANVDFSNNILQTKREWHFRCWKLKELKREFEEVIAQGLTNACPNCQYRGHKDDKCCSINCPKCDSNWCYYCEKQKNDWNSHPTCPSYLIDLATIEPFDPNWPKNAVEATAEYHRQKSLYLLKKKVAEKEASQPDLVRILVRHFGNAKILNGYTLETVKSFTLSPIFTSRKVKFTE